MFKLSMPLVSSILYHPAFDLVSHDFKDESTFIMKWKPSPRLIVTVPFSLSIGAAGGSDECNEERYAKGTEA